LLRSCCNDLTFTEAGLLAGALADLPLALTQAGGFLAETATSVTDYLSLLDTHATALLGEGNTGDYDRPLAAAVQLSIDRLAQDDPVGLAEVCVCAFLAPDSIPVHWLLAVDHLDTDLDGSLAALAGAAGNPVILRRGISSVARMGLATISRDGVRVHRLVQAVIRDWLGPAATDLREYARALLVANSPGDPETPATWQEWAKMVPHLLGVRPAATGGPALRDLACNAAWYLIERGDPDAAARLSQDLLAQWRTELGPDDVHTLWAARCLARAYREQGRYEDARHLYQEALERARHALGDDDPHTLRLAHGFAIDLRQLGQFEQARQLQQDTLARYRRILGQDHPHTLHSANHLAVDLSSLGRFEQARQLHEDTLARYRKVLGEDHPDTLRSANHLAVDLSSLGRFEQARRLHEDTLARCRRVFGEDDPHALRAANYFAGTLRMAGDLGQARELQQDTLDRYERVLGSNHPHALRAAQNLSEIDFDMGEFEESRRRQEDTLARYREVLGTNHPDTLHAAARLAEILTALAPPR
jgi:tetratricopeptide (TPR) repeat protein